MRKKFLEYLQNGVSVRHSRHMTVDMAAAAWYISAKPHLKLSTRCTYMESYMYMASDIIGDTRIRRVTRGDIIDLFRGLQARGISGSSLVVLRAALWHIFDDRVTEGDISQNPVSDIRLNSGAAWKSRDRITQIPDAFMEYVKKKNPQTHLILRLLLDTGMRVGEAGGLLWENVDLEEGYIYIEYTLKKLDRRITGSSMFLGTPKSVNSRRRIPMNDDLWQRFREHSEGKRRESSPIPVAVEKGGLKEFKSDFVFVSTKGTPITENALQKRLSRLVASYNKKTGSHMKYFNIHSTRHIFTSTAYENDADVKMISDILGHASTTTTLDNYTHLTEAKEKSMRQIMNVMGHGDSADAGQVKKRTVSKSKTHPQKPSKRSAKQVVSPQTTDEIAEYKRRREKESNVPYEIPRYLSLADLSWVDAIVERIYERTVAMRNEAE